MAKSNITVQVITFRPHFQGGCLAEMLPGTGFGGSGKPPNDDGFMSIPATYKVNLKKAIKVHDVTFSFQPQPGSAAAGDVYFPVGVYFINRDLTNPAQSVGQHVFKKFETDLTATPPTFSINLDKQHDNKENYEFLWLVQRRSDGALGIIDPEWENE